MKAKQTKVKVIWFGLLHGNVVGAWSSQDKATEALRNWPTEDNPELKAIELDWRNNNVARFKDG